ERRLSELEESSPTNKPLQHRKQAIIEPVPLPPADSDTWGPNDYTVLTNVGSGVVGIRSGKKSLYAFPSHLEVQPCPKPRSAYCLIFPNGQFVAVAPQLQNVLPFDFTERRRYFYENVKQH